jgi:hypothetical protein
MKNEDDGWEWPISKIAEGWQVTQRQLPISAEWLALTEEQKKEAWQRFGRRKMENYDLYQKGLQKKFMKTVIPKTREEMAKVHETLNDFMRTLVIQPTARELKPDTNTVKTILQTSAALTMGITLFLAGVGFDRYLISYEESQPPKIPKISHEPTRKYPVIDRKTGKVTGFHYGSP